MKYGETLQRRSIAAWRAHNIDYDEIKRFIKNRTTPGKGEGVSIPGRDDDRWFEFGGELSEILTQQHERINLFVKSKVGEIKRRLEHAQRLLRQLSSRGSVAADRRIPIARLERYSRLENDVVKIGDELRSLARFTNTNRTAFRKLIKKARKWTGSGQLCAGFQADVLDAAESFLNLDFAPYLDDYAETLANIRSLYESRMKPASKRTDENVDPKAEASIAQRLQAAIRTGSKVDFDTAIATIPLGVSGDIAKYFVHPEYAVELQVLLLHHVQPYAAKSRQNSLARSSSGADFAPANLTESKSNGQNYFMLVADNVDRFAKVEGAVTVNEREHVAGSIPQRAKYFMRWTEDENAALASRTSSNKIRTASVKRKYADTFFDKKSSERRGSEGGAADSGLSSIRDEFDKDTTTQPLYKISSRRSRFTGVGDGSKCVTLATMDTNISICAGGHATNSDSIPNFPFGVLQVRTEGEGGGDLIRALDDSHLVERVRGFSLQYHALWQTCKPANMSPPFWIDILSRDIRKLPPPAKSRTESLVPRSGSSSSSAKQHSTGTNSVRGLTDETTAVETPRPSSGAGAAAPARLETPPFKASRKKSRRKYADLADAPPQRRQRYWNEYDDPEEGDGDPNAYVIYIDPNERSTLDRLFDSLGALFRPARPADAREPDADVSGTVTPTNKQHDDDVSSSEEEPDEESALLRPSRRTHGTDPPARDPVLPQTTALCLLASVAILALAFVLAATSKHKYARTVDAAVVGAMVCCLVFAGGGAVALLGKEVGLGVWVGVGVVVVGDAVGCGGLVAWMMA